MLVKVLGIEPEESLGNGMAGEGWSSKPTTIEDWETQNWRRHAGAWWMERAERGPRLVTDMEKREICAEF